jgi:hypothetical protein
MYVTYRTYRTYGSGGGGCRGVSVSERAAGVTAYTPDDLTNHPALAEATSDESTDELTDPVSPPQPDITAERVPIDPGNA